MVKYFKFVPQINDGKVGFFIMNEPEGKIQDEYEVKNASRVYKLFDKLWDWCFIGEVSWKSIDLSPIEVGNYRFVAEKVYQVFQIEDEKNGRTRMLGESVRGRIELIDTSVSSYLSEDLMNHIDRKEFP